MSRAKTNRDSDRRRPLALILVGMLSCLTWLAPTAQAQSDGPPGGGGDPNPPQVDPNSPAERLRVIRESELERIATALESSLERLSNLAGEARPTIRREADRSIKGINEIAKRANRRLDAFQTQVLRELKNKKAPKETVTAFRNAVKGVREEIKSAQASAVRAIRDRAERVLNGQIGLPDPPASAP